MNTCARITGSETAAIRTSRSRPRAPRMPASAGTAASGSKLGRINTPIAVHAPAINDDLREPARAATSAAVQNAPAGMSLIGAID
jgi:hypothetical protein